MKLKFSEGEIDFTVRMSLTGLPPESSEKSLFLLEPLEEVLAKKLFYRGAYLAPRDLFDWSCLGSRQPETLDMERVAQVIRPRLDSIRQSLERMESSPSARKTWEQIDTPLTVEFDEAVSWGKESLEKLRDLALSGKAEKR